MEPIQMVFISNAGLMIQYRGTTLLVDGIYGAQGHPFSNLGSDTWRKILDRQAPFSKIDYLLFTHVHPDHFSPAMTLQYLERNPVKGIFKPGLEQGAALDDFLLTSRTPCVDLSEQIDHAVFQVEPYIQIHAFSTTHLDKQYWNLPHFCYLLSFDERKLLITADVDYTQEMFLQVAGIHLDGIIVNPLFFHAMKNSTTLKSRFDYEKVYIYHIPFESDDCYSMRRMLKRDLFEWKDSKSFVIPLEYSFQTVCV